MTIVASDSAGQRDTRVFVAALVNGARCEHSSGGRMVASFAGSMVVGLLAAVVVADVVRDETDETVLSTGEADEEARTGAVPLVGAGGAAVRGRRTRRHRRTGRRRPRGWLATWGAVPDDPRERRPGRRRPAGRWRPLFGVEVGPVYSDPCIDDPAGEGCPDRSEVDPAVAEGDGSLGPNAAGAHVFPRSDAELVAECGFEGLAPDALPIAVATANPGRLEVHVGATPTPTWPPSASLRVPRMAQHR